MVLTRGLGNRYAIMRTLLSNAKKFKAGFIKRIGTRILAYSTYSTKET